MKKLLFIIWSFTVCMQGYTQSHFWGVAAGGGQYNAGTIYSTDADGSNLIIKHDFFQNIGHGVTRSNGLTPVQNGYFYGMLSKGGSYGDGVIFRFDPFTTTYTKVFDFNRQENGAGPEGTLTFASDGMLYGTTRYGGANLAGILFRFDPSTNTFSKRADFASSSTGYGASSLIQATNGKLHGITFSGGTQNLGILYEYDLLTDSLVKKIDFIGINGANPCGNLFSASDGKIYGLTYQGGIANKGVMFSYDPLNGIYTKVHDFSAFGNDGDYPLASLREWEGILYGVTGGNEGVNPTPGTMFTYNISTGVYDKVFNFDRAEIISPNSALINLPNDSLFKFYGISYFGGSSNLGVLFSLDTTIETFVIPPPIPGMPPTYTTAVVWHYHNEVNFDVSKGQHPNGNLIISSDGKLYGMTEDDGLGFGGTIFQYDPSTKIFKRQVDLFSAPGGANPDGTLLKAKDGLLYGLTKTGGLYNKGTIYSIDPNTAVFTKRCDLNDSTGFLSQSTLIQASDDMIYGLAEVGGRRGEGTLFRFNPATNVCSRLLDFDGPENGKRPVGSLVEANDGMLYGTIHSGGANQYGVLFRVNPQTSTVTKMLDFDYSIGYLSESNMVKGIDGLLYGLSNAIGWYGNIFSYNSDSNTVSSKIVIQDPTAGEYFGIAMVKGTDGSFYGVAEGGIYHRGVIFQYDPIANTYNKKTDLDFGDGSKPISSLTLGSNGKLYGLTGIGSSGFSSIYEYDPLTGNIVNKSNFYSSSARAGLIEVVDSEEEKLPTANQLYPNPNNGQFTLSNLLPGKKLEVHIVDMLGKVIYKTEIESPNNKEEFEAFISKGVYLLNTTQGNSTATYKLIVQ